MDMNRELNTKDVYFSYMLRIRRLRNGEILSSSMKDIWRVSLESTQTRKCVNFASLDEMLVFLKEQFAQMDEPSDEVLQNRY